MFATFQRLYEHCKQNNVLERRETFPVFFVANAPSNTKNKRTCCFFNDTLIFLERIPFVVTSKTLHIARFGWKKGNFCVNDTTTDDSSFGRVRNCARTTKKTGYNSCLFLRRTPPLECNRKDRKTCLFGEKNMQAKPFEKLKTKRKFCLFYFEN